MTTVVANGEESDDDYDVGGMLMYCLTTYTKTDASSFDSNKQESRNSRELKEAKNNNRLQNKKQQLSTGEGKRIKFVDRSGYQNFP